MSNKYITTHCLVIVESPAKCAKIEGYLGLGYKVIASYGHLRELCSLKNINIEHGFKPTYTIIDNSLKKKQIEIIRQEINKADDVILASDDDREGEAIAWHICDMFKLDVEKTKRITFNEITESALNYAIHNPRTINMNLVYAQQARQILDLLVGFKVSPMLWKFITNHAENSLSAGRCQTPALKIIYDNQQIINNIQDATIYNTSGYFTNSNLCFKLNKQFDTKEQITDFLEGTSNFEHIYTCTTPVKSYKKQPEPFTTSTIQQTASNEFRYSPKETMKLCQKLYEAGYITYMRTDSKTYSKDFIETVKDYIDRKYPEHVHPDIELLVSGSNQAVPTKKSTKKSKTITQDAHEAIRPTNISLYNLPETIDLKEKKMYNLIWQNTLESCMAPAVFYSITATITGFTNTQYAYSSELIHFPGWKIVAQKYSTENKEYHYLQTIKPNGVIPYKKIVSQIAVKNVKHHYTEARLVQLLEENGIGRPSTFSMLVDKIQERGYVKKEDVKGKEIECCDYELTDGKIFESEVKREFGNEKGKLIIQPMGIIVMKFLEKHFLDIFNYDFTKKMEDDLDNISKGVKLPEDLIIQCNTQLDVLIDKLKTETKIEVQIDDQHTYLVGKYGPVIKCTEMDDDGKQSVSFKSIKKDVDIHQLGKESGEYTLDDIIDTIEKQQTQYILGTHEGEDVILKKGKFGLYITWGTNSKSLKEFKNRQMENITFEDVKPYLESPPNNNIVREITPELTIKKGPKGDYIFYKKPRSKKPTFFDIKSFYTDTNQDYKTCDIIALKTWIKVTHKV
jgi:DNA topoisomerase-1